MRSVVIAEESGARSERTSDGWPDIPGDTALTIRIPEADPLVRAGFPAHVTVLYPFVHESRLDDPAHRDLSGILAGHPPFTLTFAGFGRYPGVLYLDPHPHAPVKALTTDLTRRWPELVPYRGIFGPGLDPHLTIANHESPATQDAAYDTLQSDLAPLLPLRCEVDTVQLITWDGKGWRERDEYRLGPEGPRSDEGNNSLA
ncbi:2'-5' RNA ligase family protein [Streptomyces sp. 378]|uniref:2'-5' RNA ligase family protein n=1 Tax=Streptomyces sp. 378 TaxID=3049412 RepID=UPI0024C22574|nr:2'-5' RNA ligase family protein [Streptomyces sp. 378]MDK1347542.1 2'-5' RNA ligase family protein [Streptomyces sp. 378]